MNTANLRRGIKGTVLTVALLFGLTIVTSLTAQAQYRTRDDYGYGRNTYRIAAQQGYQDGMNEGAKDARDNDRYKPEGAKKYKKATEGYRSEYGNKDEYKQAYRRGFLKGYDAGFGQYADNRQGRRGNNDPYYGRDDDGRYDRTGDYGDDNGYGGYGSNDAYRVARDQGYRDGVDHGAEHAREGKSYNPEGTRHYKDANEGYRSEYGNKEQYKQAYRESFKRGYDEGYRRDSRGTNNGRTGNQRNNVRSILGTILGGGFK